MAEKTAEELEQEKNEKKQKIKFDEDQTRFVNQLYNNAFGEGAAQAERKEREAWEKKLAEERAAYEKKLADEREAWEKKVAEAAKAPEKPKTPETPIAETPKQPEVDIENHPAVKALKAQFAEMKNIFDGVKQERDTYKAETEKAKADRRKSRKKDQFISAATDAKISFFDPLEAYELAEREGLEYDDESDRVFVRNRDTGAAKLNENGEPMNAVDFVKEFATRKKYLVKAANAEGGLGSNSAERLKESETPKVDYSKLSPEEFEVERQKILSKSRE